jgi:hypothetical protein
LVAEKFPQYHKEAKEFGPQNISHHRSLLVREGINLCALVKKPKAIGKYQFPFWPSRKGSVMMFLSNGAPILYWCIRPASGFGDLEIATPPSQSYDSCAASTPTAWVCSGFC